MHLNILSGKWQPFCLSLNVLSAKENESTVNALGSYFFYMDNGDSSRGGHQRDLIRATQQIITQTAQGQKHHWSKPCPQSAVLNPRSQPHTSPGRCLFLHPLWGCFEQYAEFPGICCDVAPVYYTAGHKGSVIKSHKLGLFRECTIMSSHSVQNTMRVPHSTINFVWNTVWCHL